MKASLNTDTARTIRQHAELPVPDAQKIDAQVKVEPVVDKPRIAEKNAVVQTVIGAETGTAQPSGAHRTTPLGRGMLGTPAELYDAALGAMRRNSPTLGAELAPTIAALQTAGALDRADDAGLTLAMRAAAMGQPAVVDALAKAGANLETKNPRTGATILHYAAAAQGAAGVATLDALPRDVVGRLVNETIGSNRHTVAMEAVFQSNEGFVRRLVALSGEGVNVDFTSRQLMGWSPRTFAARDGRDWHTIIPAPDAENQAILDRAAQALTAGRPPAEVQTELRTALMGAQGQWVGREDAAWLAAIVDPVARARAADGMALLAAAQGGNLAEVDRLVASGVSITGTYGRAGSTVLTNLFVGALSPEQLTQRQATLTALLARGADPNVAESALMLVPSGFREAVFGRTAALDTMIGSMKGDPARLRAFLDVQGPLNGYTKLIDAALRGNPDVISLLVRSGADTTKAGYNGMTALDALRVFNTSQRDPARQISEALLTPAGATAARDVAVRGVVDRFYADFPNNVRAVSTPDIATVVPGTLPFSGTFDGVDGTMRSIATWGATLSGVRPIPRADGGAEPITTQIDANEAARWLAKNGHDASAAKLKDGDAFVKLSVEVTHVNGVAVEPFRHVWLEKLHVNAEGRADKLDLFLAPADEAKIEALSAKTFAAGQAFSLFDRLIDAKDPVTGLLPMHVRTENGRLVATDHVASGLDSGRSTAGLVMAADVAKANGDTARAKRYLAEAEAQWAAAKKNLTHGAQGDVIVHLRDFNDDGSVRSTNVGEPGKSAAGEDNMTRVNPRAYAFRGVGELYRATGKAEHKADFEKFFSAWVRDFHDPVNGGFFVHANIEKKGDHTERDSFVAPGGAPSAYSGHAGVKGNDATVYALSSVLLLANDLLGTKQTQSLVREQIDLLLNTFQRTNGMLWENYTSDWKPVSTGWQNQALDGSSTTSHVAIGGHTAMAPQQMIEGARQLKKQGAISDAEYRGYMDGAVKMLADMARDSGAIDWNSGAVRNAIRVEEQDQSKRWIAPWGNASWQQHELIQTLLRIGEEGRLGEIKGPDGKTGADLLRLAEHNLSTNNRLASDYSFNEFGNGDVYHIPQDALYHAQQR